MKEKNDQLRQDIKNKIKMARKSVMEQRQERCQLISEEFAENEKKIRELREKELETNKEKKKFILFEE